MQNKKRWIALLINIFMGVGYLYIGKIKKAIFFSFVTSVTIIPAIYLEVQLNFTLLFWLVITIGLWIYSFIDIWKSFPLQDTKAHWYTKWYSITFVIILLQLLIYPLETFIKEDAPVRSFIIPSKAMQTTLEVGDYVIGHRKKEIKRGEVAIFRYPHKKNIFYIKRVVAKGGDEVVYQDKHLYVHFVEGDEYIKQNYTSEKIKNFRGKLWVDNPYMSQHLGINYIPTHQDAFSNLLAVEQGIISSYKGSMQPIYIKELGEIMAKSKNDKPINAFYKKVDEESYFMMGDNRDNSADSRFWGLVKQDLIFGYPKIIYFNWKHFNRFGMEVK